MAATVLVAEDDDDDFFFTARVLSRAAAGRVMRVESGRAAIDYLAGAGLYSDREKYPRPDLMLLDLKMDDLDGHGVLAWLRENPPSPQLRVFVLTGSGELRDRERVQASAAAHGYLVKPLTAAHVAEMLGGQP